MLITKLGLEMQYDKPVSSKPDSFFIQAYTLCCGWVNLHTMLPAAVTWRDPSFEDTRWENNYCMYTPCQELNHVTKRALHTSIHGFQMRSWHPTSTSGTIQCTWKLLLADLTKSRDITLLRLDCLQRLWHHNSLCSPSPHRVCRN